MIVEFEDIKLEVVQNYKPQNRHIYLRIKDGKLEINTFKILSETDIISFIKRNYTSIKKTLLKSEKPTNHQLHLFGKAYDFKIVEASKNNVEIIDDYLLISTKVNEYGYISKLVKKFYNDMIQYYCINHFDSIFDLFSDVVNSKPKLQYKYLTSCFGKYDKKKHNITISGFLAKYEPKLIDLVICHELCHCKFMNHQKGFYDLFEQKYKNARKNQHILRKIKYNDYF